MVEQLRHSLREAALADLPLIVHSQWGLLASGAGRFTTYFGRDAAKSIILSLSKPQNMQVPQLLDAALLSQRTAARLQGKAFNPLTEEAPGKMPHECHDHNSPQARLGIMRTAGWPVFEHEDGSLGMVYYGAGDSTALFTISVAVVARAFGRVSAAESFNYLKEFWPHVEAGIRHDIEIADSDGDGLIESRPQNMAALLNHTWKDSHDAYLTEEGELPPPPYKYLNNNCYFLWSLREAAWMAGELGLSDTAAMLAQRYSEGVALLHRLFWVEDRAYFAPLIDGSGQPVLFIGDDVLDGLWGNIFDREKAALVIARLRQPDMNTPCGLRTRSSLSKQFHVNGPPAYHNGLVWLHRNRIAAEGLENYGAVELADEVDEKMALVESQCGRIECVSVDGNGRLLEYEENGEAVACKPQSWAVHGTLARTA